MPEAEEIPKKGWGPWRVLGLAAVLIAVCGAAVYLGLWALIAFTFRDSATFNKHPMLFEVLTYEAPKSEVWWDTVDGHLTLYFTDCQVHHVSKLSLNMTESGPGTKGGAAPLETDLVNVMVPAKGLQVDTVLPGSDRLLSSHSQPQFWSASVIDVQSGTKTGQLSIGSLNDGSIEWTNIPQSSGSASSSQHPKVEACLRR